MNRVFMLLPLLGGVALHAANLPSDFVEETVGSGWNEAVGLTFGPDGRLFVWERGGRVWTVENGVKSAAPFLDIAEEVGGWRDFGLLGFALHPGFQTNGHVYLMYVVDRHHLLHFGTPNYRTSSNQFFNATIGRITRYTARASDGRRSVDPASRRVLVGEHRTNGFPVLHESHGVGTLLFGTDGTLLASCGDGASYSSTDAGSAAETYWQTALNEGIIRPKENVGAFRSQLVDCLNGKILRLDPETGDGVPGNPYFVAANPRAPRSRVWALGLRNAFRMALRPGSGSTDPSEGRPGVIYIGDVGYGTWEELNVCDQPGQNFGWPLYEGLQGEPGYMNASAVNRDAPNPLNGTGGCTQQYFLFRELLVQDTLNTPSWPNPCNTSQQIPSTVRRFVHRRPSIDWRHDSTPNARTGVYSNNNAAVVQIGAPGSPVTGSMFSGNSSTGGAWYTNTSFPPQFRNTYFQADFVGRWIRSFVFTGDNRPAAVQTFLSNADGGLVALTVDPATGHLYYIAWTDTLRRIRYTAAANQPPIAVANANRSFGPAPLTVQFSSASSDPEGLPLEYRWTFGDGTTASTNANPGHTFNASVPTNYIVTLVVTDRMGLRATNRLTISANNTPPSIGITSPVDGTIYSVSNGTTYACTATVNDAEHARDQLRCAWQTILHHDDHQHPEPVDTNCTTATVISPTGCDGATYYYRVVLVVTDPLGLSATNQVRLYPNCPTTNTGPEILIAAGATWRYLDTGSDAGIEWHSVAFDDSSWSTGAAELGYGDQDEETEVGYGPNIDDKYVTTYFRHSFIATNSAGYGRLNIRLLRDDGAVVYLNGNEALRNNMPTNAITYTTRALANVAGTNETFWISSALNPALVHNGTNVLAVEIHQSGPMSSDISFNLELVALPAVQPPFLRAAVLPDGRVRLSFHGNGGTAYVTEASTNLSQWSAVSTNSAGGAIEHTDVNASTGRRFFRVRQVQ